MDSLRGDYFGTGHDPQPYNSDDDDELHNDVPPSPVGQDERRMQVRAYNFWASLLHNRNYPSIDDLHPEHLPDFGPNSVLLDFSTGIEDPAVAYLGDKLAHECEGDGEIEHLSDVPARSLLSRITDHYMQILANQAPIGFEAEFVNQAGNTVLYRGILLPFSSDDDAIDFIYGVINWKELADQDATDALMQEVDQSLDLSLEDIMREEEGEDEDGDVALPSMSALVSKPDAANRKPLIDETGAIAEYPETQDDDDIMASAYDAMNELPEPSFGLRRTVDQIVPPVVEEDNVIEEPVAVESEDEPFDLAAFVAEDVADDDELLVLDSFETDDAFELSEDDLLPTEEAIDERGEAQVEEPAGLPVLPSDFDAAPAAIEAVEVELEQRDIEAPAEPEFAENHTETENAFEELDDSEAEMELADWLASARELAQAAKGSEERTRSALYDAIGRAYDFSLAAQDDPAEFEELVADAGLAVQERAPMTPIVKLVFGADYDKTRITEYAAALSHGHRLGVGRGELSGFLSQAKGGLKGVVGEERKLRRAQQGKPVEDTDGPRTSLAKKLRKLEPQSFDALDSEGAEFGLVMIRREADGTISILGEVPDDVPLVERAARKLLG